MFRTSNPTLSPAVFNQPIAAGEQRMTIQGTVNKTGILLVLAVLFASLSWSKVAENPASAGIFIGVGAIGGFIVAMVTFFKKQWSPVTAPIYALLEGLVIGAISSIFNRQWNGIVLQAAMLTFGTLFAMLVAYRSGWIRATEKFKLGVVAATGGIVILYLVSWILSMFHVNMSFMYGSGMLSIGISVFVVIIAALNLTRDCCRFDGIRLQTDGWQVRPLAVEHVESSFFSDDSKFPAGSVIFDHALVMRDVGHQWHVEADMFTK